MSACRIQSPRCRCPCRHNRRGRRNTIRRRRPSGPCRSRYRARANRASARARSISSRSRWTVRIAPSKHRPRRPTSDSRRDSRCGRRRDSRYPSNGTDDGHGDGRCRRVRGDPRSRVLFVRERRGERNHRRTPAPESPCGVRVARRGRRGWESTVTGSPNGLSSNECHRATEPHRLRPDGRPRHGRLVLNPNVQVGPDPASMPRVDRRLRASRRFGGLPANGLRAVPPPA